ncbi:hypothetical protein TanjilG_17725 [Lupinus angustifolius]|uniref:Uncharacterized protein n=1 Tax=Lupinus angustifolius TaxID=3871 RepID=A0A394DFY8_LUPAN|nr:hypothetical protein TanjilG_17725 [Lupinus angustifolius]
MVRTKLNKLSKVRPLHPYCNKNDKVVYSFWKHYCDFVTSPHFKTRKLSVSGHVKDHGGGLLNNLMNLEEEKSMKTEMFTIHILTP